MCLVMPTKTKRHGSQECTECASVQHDNPAENFGSFHFTPQQQEENGARPPPYEQKQQQLDGGLV